ncbi:phosphatase PAP2 family protein [Natronobiforma cellulositropha]|uniref:phosphatase PAP2 family protein n=1 Tax=Natronobiforma cellulositropha TaxID=1679076 RepID=UPI0021D59871|nr:phosphatase PAP2 family protein [Natronobiforma cellulositropha]
MRTTLEGIFFDESTNVGVRETIPEALIPGFELATHLGDGATLIVFATLLYWFGAESSREKRALVIAIGLGALAISAGMKGIFQHPRPVEHLAFAPAGYGGYSFPSAHALGAAAFYGAMAAVAETGTRRQRYAVAGVVIGVVALSRVVIGVHYLGDVVVGVALGLLFVWAVLRSGDTEPTAVFALSGLIAIGAYALGSREFTTLTIGAALGATAAWYVVRGESYRPYGASILVLALLTLPAIVALRLVSGHVGGYWPLEVAGYAAATAAVLVVPAVAERLNGWPQVAWLQRRLPFSGRTVDVEAFSSGVTETKRGREGD